MKRLTVRQRNIGSTPTVKNWGEMAVSENVRLLAREGLSVSEIAQRLGIRYQHAYNVLRQSGQIKRSAKIEPKAKPALLVADIVRSGFTLAGRWRLNDDGQAFVDGQLPKPVGVYAFAKQEFVLYVGVATIGIAKRLYFYAHPGQSQRTNQRLNEIIRLELATAPHIDIYTASPPNLEWNGLPVHGSAGLELGLITKYALPWNKRSANAPPL